MMEKNAKIYVAGHRGMVGSAILRELQRQGYTNFVLRTHRELDLLNQNAVEEFFRTEKPEYVFLAAAKVGGIVANESALADFMYDNMMLEMNVIHSLTVKVVLNPGHKMNYHSHERRDEVWTVLSGAGKTIVDGMEQPVKPGDVITMAAGCKHTVIAGDEGLQLMEVQLGEAISASDKKKYEWPL